MGKAALEELGISTEGYLDKDSLLELLAARGETALRNSERLKEVKRQQEAAEQQQRFEAADRAFGIGRDEEFWGEKDYVVKEAQRRLDKTFPDHKVKRVMIHH